MATGEETGRIKLFRAPVNQRKVCLFWNVLFAIRRTDSPVTS